MMHNIWTKNFYILLISLIILSIFATNIKADYYVEKPKDYIFEVGIPGIVAAGTKLSVKGLPNMLLKAIFWLYIAGAIIAFISLIIAGFNYMFSGGNASKTKKAIDQIKQAFIGLFILLGAYTILYTINPDLVVIPTNLFGAPPYLEQLNVPSDMNEEAAREILIEGYDYNPVEDNLVDQIKDDLQTRSDIAMDGNVIKDLDNQKLNPLILQVIDFVMNNWDKPSDCGQLIIGPGVTGHVKNIDVHGPDYQSCHDLGMAIDFEIPGINEPWGQTSTQKTKCQASLQSALKKSTLYGAITILDEQTHIHIQTADCPYY